MPKSAATVHQKLARTVVVVAAIVVAVSGCTSDAPAVSSEPIDDSRPLVLTTFTVIADMVRTVAGDHVEVHSITRIGAEIHGYEPTPSDLVSAASADLILDNGFGLERWFESFVAGLDVPHVVLTDGIEPVNIRTGEYEGLPNPHAWMSPIAGQTYIDNIVAALGELVPDAADEFAANGSAVKAQLQALADEFEQAIATIPVQHRVLVTCEGAFSYLARDLGLEEVYLWPVNADTQGTPQQIRNAITLVRERGVPSVFCETTVNDASQKQVARESGAEFAGSLYVDSLSEEDGPVPTYLDLLRFDVDAIAKGLRR